MKRCGKKRVKDKMENGPRYDEVHFNLQFINKSMYRKEKHTIRNVLNGLHFGVHDVVERKNKKNGSIVIGFPPSRTQFLECVMIVIIQDPFCDNLRSYVMVPNKVIKKSGRYAPIYIHTTI